MTFMLETAHLCHTQQCYSVLENIRPPGGKTKPSYQVPSCGGFSQDITQPVPGCKMKHFYNESQRTCGVHINCLKCKVRERFPFCKETRRQLATAHRQSWRYNVPGRTLTSTRQLNRMLVYISKVRMQAVYRTDAS